MWRLYTVIGLAVLIALLHHAFPYALEDENARMRVLYLVLLLSLGFAGGRRAFRNKPLPKIARDIGIWLALFIVLIGAYSLRDEFGHNRLMAELIPSQVQENKDGTMSIRSSENGHFYAEGEINSVPVRFLIDTGATGIVLSPDDAKRIGFDTETLDYSNYTATANGMGTGASVILNTLKVGSITFRQVPATVNKVWMHESLLGMSFLNRLKGFRVDGNKLVLVP